MQLSVLEIGLENIAQIGLLAFNLIQSEFEYSVLENCGMEQ
jgi:hypothetical protein